MKNIAYAPVCGIYCGACQFLGKQCPACGKVDGKPFWTTDMPGSICPLHDCCRNQRQLEHCGLCADFPCKTFNELRDPGMSDEEFTALLQVRKLNLKIRREIGTAAWLKKIADQLSDDSDTAFDASGV